MSNEEESYKKYDHASSLSRQIERVNEQIVRGLSGSEYSDKDDYLDSIILGLMTIENFYLHTFTDENYNRISNNKVFGYNTRKKLEFINKAQRHLSKLMDEEELFFTTYKKEKLGSKDKKNRDNK